MPASARDYLARELSRIAQALESVDALSLATKGAEPDKYSDGDIVYADGTAWDPGSGEGMYVREGGAWVKTGGGGGGGASQLSDLSDVNTSTPTNRNALLADGVDFESRAIVEADVSDLGSYGDITADEEVTGSWRSENGWTAFRGAWATAPQCSFKETGTNSAYVRGTFQLGRTSGSVTNVGLWIRPDTASGTRKPALFEVLDQGAGTAASQCRAGFNLRSATETIFATSKGNGGSVGTDLYIGTRGITSTNSQQIVVRQSQNRVDIRPRNGLRILESGTGSDYINIAHDGIDVNFTHSGTTDWNITGVTTIQAGTVDADFDAITATSYGGIAESNLLDKSAAETVTGAWVFSSGLNALSESRSVSASTNTASTDYGIIINLIGGTGQTFTLDSDPPTDAVVLFDNSSGNSWTIAASTSLIWASDGTTGNRTLADDGLAVAKHRGSGTWVINGGGLT